MYKLGIFVSLVLATIGGALLLLYLHRFELERSGGAPIAVLVVAKPIKKDAVLTAESVTTREIPGAYVDSRAVRASEQKRILGVRTANAAQPGQVLTWTDIAVGGNERRSLSSLIQPGLRAVTLKARNDSAAFDLIEPGDRVDVLTTAATPADRGAPPSPPKLATLLLQNVLVLAVGQNTGDEALAQAQKAPGGRREQVLTLSLPVPDAQVLAVAMEKGPLAVAVRNPDDVRIVEVPAEAPVEREPHAGPSSRLGAQRSPALARRTSAKDADL